MALEVLSDLMGDAALGRDTADPSEGDFGQFRSDLSRLRIKRTEAEWQCEAARERVAKAIFFCRMYFDTAQAAK